MADIQKTVEIVFGAVDQTGQGLQSFADGLDSINQKLNQAVQPIADFTDKLLLVEAATVAAGAAMLSFAVNEAGKFNASVAEIGTLFGGTKDQVSAFGSDIQAFAVNSTQSIDSINSAVYGAISAGTSYTDSLDLIRQTEQLSVAGRADLGETTKLVTGILNAYGLETSHAADVSDILFTAVKNGQLTLPELNASLGQVTSTAAAAGVPFEQVAASIAAATANGLGASQSITGLKAALSNIIQPSTDAEKAAAALGIQFDANALKTQGLDGLLGQLQQATGGSTDAMAQFFGSIEGLNFAIAASGNGMGTFTSNMEQMGSRAGITAQAYQAMADNLDLATQKMINNFSVAAQKIGTPLLDEWTGIINQISNLFKGVSISIDAGAFAPVFTALESFGKDVEAFLSAVAQNLPAALEKVDFTNLIQSFQGLGVSLGGLFDGVDLTTVDGLASAIQTMSDGLASLTKVVTGVVDQWKPLILQFIEAGKEFNNTDTETQKFIGRIGGLAQQLTLLDGPINVIVGSVGLLANSLIILNSLGVSTGLASTAAAASSAGASLTTAAAAAGTTALTWGSAATVAGALGIAIGTLTSEGIGKFISAVTGSEQSIGTWLYEVQHGKDEAKLMGDTIVDTAAAVQKFNDSLPTQPMRDFDGEVAAAAESSLSLNDIMAQAQTGFLNLGLAIDPVTGAVTALSNSFNDTSQNANKIAASFGTLAEAEANAAQVMGFAKDVSIAFQGGQYVLNATLQDTAQQFAGIDDVTDQYSTGITKAKKSTDEIAKAQEEAAKRAQELQIKMLELASDERIKSMEFEMNINVAEIQAQADIVVQIFQTLGTAISAVEETVQALFSQDAPDWDWSGTETAQAAKDANDRANALNASLIALNQAQIDYMNAKTQSLLNNGGLITINADNLAPELQMVLRSLLEEIQIQATAEGLEVLLS